MHARIAADEWTADSDGFRFEGSISDSSSLLRLVRLSDMLCCDWQAVLCSGVRSAPRKETRPHQKPGRKGNRHRARSRWLHRDLSAAQAIEDACFQG